MASIPPILPFPSQSVHTQLPPEEWQACLDIWVSGVEQRLRASEDDFSEPPLKSSTLTFLHTFWAPSSSDVSTSKLTLLVKALMRKLLLSKHMILTNEEYFDLLYRSSGTFSQSPAWRKVLQTCWTTNKVALKKAVESAKVLLASSDDATTRTSILHKITVLTKALPEVSTITVSSADYLDTLNDAFRSSESSLAKVITENVYHSFLALIKTGHITILTDNIYHMKSEADRLQKSFPTEPTLLSSLLCTTSFMKHFAGSSEIAKRKQTLVDQLNAYRQDMLHLHPLPRRPRKGKEKAHHTDENMHIHRAAQVSQIHELFPHLTANYILRALDHFSENVESVIAALLEPSSLPLSLQDQDSIPTDAETRSEDLAPRSTPPYLPERVSKPEDLDIDLLDLDAKNLRRGKKDLSVAETITAAEQSKTKAAIMSALAAFDSDDDERDDTYDVADIGGAVDNTVDTDERRAPNTDVHEASLFKAWKETPDLFARDSKTRASNIRQQLKQETSMSDEQIEGWAIMLNKDKKMQDKLQDKYASVRAFGGQQRLLQSTKWQATTSTENSENESGPERSNDSRRQGMAGIRGHRDFGRGRGRGGSTSGPSDDAATQAARKRKEQGRGRGGGNNRRDARAKKVGRGMGPLPPS